MQQHAFVQPEKKKARLYLIQMGKAVGPARGERVKLEDSIKRPEHAFC